jgi:hypothetical protein
MTDKTRIKIAAAVTALFLAGISIVGLAARSDSPQKTAVTDAAAPAVQAPTTAKSSVASSTPAWVEDDGYENEAESLSDEQEGYDAERYGEREDHD